MPTETGTPVAFSPLNFDATLGMGGYAFAYADSAGSVACLDESAFCGAGTTALQTAPNAFGAGIGVNLNQGMGSAGGGSPTAGMYTPTGKSGIAYALSGTPPAKLVMIIDNAGVAYQANVVGTSGMIPWAMFTVQTPDAGAPTLSGPPSATHINLQANAGATAGTFNFCVTMLGFY